MNAEEQERIAMKLQQALDEAGIVIERAEASGGNVSGWHPIPMPALIGRMLQLGWRIRLVAPKLAANPRPQ